MKRTRRLEVMIEVDRLVVQNSGKRIWCSACQAQVPNVTIDEAALLLGLTSRAIFRRVEEEILHSIEVPQGLLRICLNSLTSTQRDSTKHF